MDVKEIEKFISDNKHLLGFIMQEASNKWVKMDEIGALTVGPCNLLINLYGDYNKILEDNKRLKKENDQLKMDKEDMYQIATRGNFDIMDWKEMMSILSDNK